MICKKYIFAFKSYVILNNPFFPSLAYKQAIPVSAGGCEGLSTDCFCYIRD